MIPNRAARVIVFAKKFKGRLEDIWVETVLDYVVHNEVPLAFDILCDYLSDYNVSLSVEEYDEILQLAEDIELDLNEDILKHLKYLARRGGDKK